MPFETILHNLQDGILTLTLNRPDKLNAVTPLLLRELREAFEQAAGDRTVRVIVLTGAGRGFCAGADLGAASELIAAGGFSYEDNLNTTYNPLIMAMQRVPQPIIAAVNGVAAGAGMSLALACDLRIAAESASFLQAFVKIGLVPDSGSTWLLPRLIGTARALELMLTGRKVSAQEAFALGIVNQVVQDADLANTVAGMAQTFAAAPTKTIGLIKQAVNFAMTSTLEEVLHKEAVLQGEAGATADHAEGIAAFLSKRPPNFTGE
ncbi:MAG: enoyl-CoA hydratase/isomerase family protein [Chloroflexi bacterium]|nr:enoyl-CoA hydratase/isomerase family protein [Chloroflexota bacterium]MCC6892157.1 enoyl-CoA hydratase/isomerase family protein [Anaerolineae bacterium]